MTAPSDFKASLWGAAAGAALLVSIGFMWSGWVTSRTVEAQTRQQGSEVVLTGARACVAKFRQQVDMAASLTDLRAASPPQQGPLIEKGGWATMADASRSEAAVARACAELLAEEP